MREIADDFLLHVAEISASLVGLFFVGIFLYVQVVLGRRRESVDEGRYIRSSAQVVIVLSAISIGVPLTLVAFEPAWNRVIFLGLSVLLIAATVDRLRRFRQLVAGRATPMLLASEAVATVGAVMVVVVPWLARGLDAGRQELTLGALLALATGLFSIWAMVSIAFDIGGRQPDDGPLRPD